jgi:transcriptional regulator with XRE-family HTH domain
MTQTELARRTGIPQWRISLLERGKPASSDECRRLAAALGVTPKELWPDLAGGMEKIEITG